MPRVRVRSKPNRPLQLFFVDPLTGQDRTRSAKTYDWADAEREAAKWELELEQRGEVRQQGPVTWHVFRRRFTDEWLRTLRRKSMGAYITALNHFERIIGEPKDVALVDPDTMSRFMGELVHEKRPLSTVANYVKHVLSALGWAKSRRWLREVPTIALPPQDQANQSKGRAITDDEYAALLAAVPKVFKGKRLAPVAAQWRRFIEVLRLSGERVGGALQLSWDSPPLQIDLTGGKIPRLIVHGSGQKSRKAEIAPLAPDFAAWLRAVPPEQRHGLVCPLKGRDGKRIRASHSVSRHFGAIAEAAGVDCTAHDLRRTFATYWSSRVKPLTLKRLMRHASLKTTLTFYVGQDADDVAPDLYPHLYRESRPRSERKETKRTRKQGKRKG